MCTEDIEDLGNASLGDLAMGPGWSFHMGNDHGSYRVQVE